MHVGSETDLDYNSKFTINEHGCLGNLMINVYILVCLSLDFLL